MSVESVLRNDRRIVLGALVLVSFLAWGWMLSGAGMGMGAFEMTRHINMSMNVMEPPVWTSNYLVLMFFMWWIMMIAMMLPSATPIILLTAALNRRSTSTSPPFGPTGMFVAGYLFAWAGFSIIAVGFQWWMQHNGWLNSMLVGQSRSINGLLLLLAGVWQFSPWKAACLQHCQSPVEFVTRQRRNGKSGALKMGLTHGGFCLGCCWFLMTLLFVGGVMNLYWIIGLTVYVWLEKTLPFGTKASRFIGVLLTIWGLYLLSGISIYAQ